MSTQSRDLIRDATKAEEHALYSGNHCPFCGGSQFIEGPSGGASTNIYCANEACDARFNICYPLTPQVIRESKLPHPVALPEPVRAIEATSISTSAAKAHRPSGGLATGLVTGACLFSIWMVFETLRLHEWPLLIPVGFITVPLSLATWQMWCRRHRKGSWQAFTWGFAGGCGMLIGIALMDLFWRVWHSQGL